MMEDIHYYVDQRANMIQPNRRNSKSNLSDMTRCVEVKRKILIKKRCNSVDRTAIIWAILLYGLVQIFITDFSPNNSSYLIKPHNDPTISCTVEAIIDSSSNEELPSFYGSNRSKQLCSSIAREATERVRKYSRQDSIIKSAQPLSSSSTFSSLIHSSLLQILENFKSSNDITNEQRHQSSFFGFRILMAEAVSLYKPGHEKEIIVLNSTNFSNEILQHQHPFPHLNLIEFYVSFCSFCSRFKTTYTTLAKEIYPWRNVIRSSVIDIGVSNNAPIAQAWSVDTVPTLRIYPPPERVWASDINQHIVSKIQKDSIELKQNYLADEYKKSNLNTLSLHPEKYIGEVPKFKTDLIEYIDSYVRSGERNYIPDSWPNLKPVIESSLSKLLSNHPRQELFLLIVGPSDLSRANLGLRVILQLSSSASWKAIRYVHSSENKALVEDVIVQLKKSSGQPIDQINEQVDILKGFLTSESSAPDSGNIVLIHTDDSQSLVKAESSSFSSMTAVTGQDLLNMEQTSERSSNRIKRTVDHKIGRRSMFDSASETLSQDRQAELIAKHIAHTYSETREDRKFVQAISVINADISISSNELQDEVDNGSLTTNLKKTRNQNELDNSGNSFFARMINVINSDEESDQQSAEYSQSTTGDYYDKIKAIRYMFFNEIPRASFADKSITEQREKLSILLNLVSVIKSYFPLPDSASIQFFDGVHNYLLKQQSRLSSVNNRDERGSLGFDPRAFKQELKRLESEDKRLLEVKEYKYCAKWGYPCALWRFFHTLTAFEYKKLNQIRLIPQASTGIQQLADNSSIAYAAPVVESMGKIKSTTSLNDVPSPVEHLVSPPSTTTSLSLTIVGKGDRNTNVISNQKPMTEADLPTPVLLVMRDYITNFFACSECAKNFRQESAELSFERIRQIEPAEFSVFWLWETHNRVNKRLSVDPVTNPPDHPKLWFPSYGQCSKCYKKPPSFMNDLTADATIFHESIEWDKPEILNFLICEYTKQPMDYSDKLFAHNLPGFGYIIIACICLLALTMLIRCTTQYLERQRRHKATLLNGNGARYTLELQ